ncbi:hypothetical protein L1049_024232 [Liquidambar formosana]|uniref:Uncharacterized protein n=1 Tax=Liquidambar formosana TaxID=63359 RepID=A0AAP0RU42_LIQFO
MWAGGGGDGFVEISDDGADLSDELKSAMKGSEKTEVSNVGEKRPMMRRKTVARNTKKIMGRGNRGRRIGTAAAAEEGNVEGRSEGEGCGVGSSGGKGRGSEEGFVVGGVEYFEGDDDILVGLPIVDDGGKGKVEASS